MAQLTWKPLSVPQVEARLRYCLESWEGTPYREGDQVKKIGVDCFRFVCGVLDEMCGFCRALPANLPSDQAMHDPESAKAAMRQIIRLYEPVEEVLDSVVEPGDILVMALPGGGPGHAMIAGPDPNQLWHVEPASGVCYTGLGMSGMELHKVYRIEGKHLWL